ncbi:MAG TPA: carbohydrate ABC transporter permease, partial [Candidatus Avimonas sp.]|nr:carbohydrate ABC transporter permease [Candidatus Avimonas sp.]
NMFPTVLLLIPLYAIMRKLGILYTPIALVLAYTTFTIPFSVWLLNGYLNDLPMSLEEAALVDGANRPQAFIRIVLPILIPCLVATGVYIFMNAWNEYTFAVMFTNEKSRTIPVSLRNLIGQLGVQWDLLTAGGIITIIPVCVMFFFAQKRLVEGLTAGAVKG